MIRSWKGRTIELLAAGRSVKGFPADLIRPAQRKLRYLADAGRLSDLASPPGNRLEAPKGDRSGQYSIRINDQWRICFRWTDEGAEDIEIVDYH
ncbi:type II toxin-antitoxin system RelE/ParE family toxin [Jiella avicenniae]|uniref:Type II toxin-antitoxin system RelE/ParE family toxin n=1 Tax=Jiella avicenniae TaxID=2907202 RepID=A0A9X1T7R0_9HYPH|nr:type II toxin-antitoxin system RelE/ParE family toxin [Jiella avicenniae]